MSISFLVKGDDELTVLELKNLSKSFGASQALKNINLELKKGEIHGLIGANGSGKSTLMNILNGDSKIIETGGYSGEILINNKVVNIKNRQDAINNGIAMVHQELSLIDNLTINENINLNNEYTKEYTDFLHSLSLLDDCKNKKTSLKALKSLGIKINIDQKVTDLKVAEKQFIEIAKTINNSDLKILMLDEPTSSLSYNDTEKLLDHIKTLSENGVTILFVSHRLEEVIKICDRITIIRDGELISQLNKEEFDLDKISMDMVGTKVIKTTNIFNSPKEKKILQFKDLEILDNRFNKHKLNLDVYDGEILGITGLSGSGYEIFPYALMNLYNKAGKIIYDNVDITNFSNQDILNLGLYLIPEDRSKMSLLLNKAIWENIIFETFKNNPNFLYFPYLGKLSLLNKKVIFSHCNNIIEELNIKANNSNQIVKELSGGNQQKVCIGRAITFNPKLLFIGEPTRGIDIYSKELILNMLLKLNIKNNASIVIYSGEVEELMRMCNRIVIMKDHNILSIFSREQFNSKDFKLAISGRKD